MLLTPENMFNTSTFDNAEATAEELGVPQWVFILVVAILVLMPLCYVWSCLRNGASNVMCLCNACSSGYRRLG